MGEGKQIARGWSAGTVKRNYDDTANDSDKTVLTVPANKQCFVKYVWAYVVTTATAGNRKMVLLITDGTNTIGTFTNYISLTAGLTTYWLWAPAEPKPGSLVAGSTHGAGIPMKLTLPAGYTVRVYDSATVDAAGDDMTTVIMYEEIDV